MREARLSTLKGCGNSTAADRAAAVQETLQCLNLLVERHLPGVELREHGAHLKGTATAHSDIDLVLVTTSGADPSATLRLLWDCLQPSLEVLLQQMARFKICEEFRVDTAAVDSSIPCLVIHVTPELHMDVTVQVGRHDGLEMVEVICRMRRSHPRELRRWTQIVCFLKEMLRCSGLLAKGRVRAGLASFHVEIMVLCYLLDRAAWPSDRREVPLKGIRTAQLLLDLVEFYATEFQPAEARIWHTPGADTLCFRERGPGFRSDQEVVMSALTVTGCGDECCEGPFLWDLKVRPFLQQIASGIRGQSWSAAQSRLLSRGTSRLGKAERRERKGSHAARAAGEGKV